MSEYEFEERKEKIRITDDILTDSAVTYSAVQFYNYCTYGTAILRYCTYCTYCTKVYCTKNSELKSIVCMSYTVYCAEANKGVLYRTVL